MKIGINWVLPEMMDSDLNMIKDWIRNEGFNYFTVRKSGTRSLNNGYHFRSDYHVLIPVHLYNDKPTDKQLDFLRTKLEENLRNVDIYNVKIEILNHPIDESIIQLFPESETYHLDKYGVIHLTIKSIHDELSVEKTLCESFDKVIR